MSNRNVGHGVQVAGMRSSEDDGEGRAGEKNLLSDYKVIVLTVTKKDILNCGVK